MRGTLVGYSSRLVRSLAFTFYPVLFDLTHDWNAGRVFPLLRPTD
jgi:hypothetical protein